MKDNEKYLGILFLITCWAIVPFCKKNSMINISHEEYFVVNFILTSIIAIFVVFYFVIRQKVKSNIFVKTSKTELGWAFTSALMSILGAYVLIQLVQYYEVSHILPQINPCVILLTIVLGLFFFKESITFNKILGSFILIIGLYVINKK